MVVKSVSELTSRGAHVSRFANFFVLEFPEIFQVLLTSLNALSVQLEILTFEDLIFRIICFSLH